LINKTFKQLNAERAVRRAQPWPKRKYSWEEKKIKQKNKAASSQAGGPSPKESGLKRHQKNTKVFKTLQDAIDYNAKERS